MHLSDVSMHSCDVTMHSCIHMMYLCIQMMYPILQPPDVFIHIAYISLHRLNDLFITKASADDGCNSMVDAWCQTKWQRRYIVKPSKLERNTVSQLPGRKGCIGTYIRAM